MRKIITSVSTVLLAVTTLTGCNDYPDKAKLDFQSDIQQDQVAFAAKRIHLIPLDDSDLKEWIIKIKELEKNTLGNIKGREVTDDVFTQVQTLAKQIASSPLGQQPAPNTEIGTVEQFLTINGQLYLHDKELKEDIAKHQAVIQSQQVALDKLKEVHDRSAAASDKLKEILKPYDEKLTALQSTASLAQSNMNEALKKLNPLDFNVREFDIKASWYPFSGKDRAIPDCVTDIESRMKASSRASGIIAFPTFKGEEGRYYCSYMDSIGGGENTQARFVAALKSTGIDILVMNYVKAVVLLDADTDYLTSLRKNAERAETDLKSQINLMSFSERKSWDYSQKTIASKQAEIKQLEDYNSDDNRQKLYRENLTAAVHSLFTRYTIFLLAEDHDLLTFDYKGELELTGDEQYVLINEVNPRKPTYELIDATTFKEQNILLISADPSQYKKFKNFTQGLADKLFQKG